MMGVTELLEPDISSKEDVSGWTVAGAAILALLYTIVSIVVLLTMVMVLAMRIIMIWIYVVMSPMAYLLASFPQGESYANQWWSEFSKNLIVGPVLAFFIWLSFVSLGGVGTNTTVSSMTDNLNSETQAFDENGVASGTTVPSAAMTEAGSADHMLKFFISIAMLVGGLQISQQIGGAAGGVAKNSLDKLKSYGSQATNWGKRTAGAVAKKGAIYGVAGLKTAGGTIDKGLGRAVASLRNKTPEQMAKSSMVNKGLIGAGVGATGAFLKNATSGLRKNNVEREEQQKIRRDMADNKNNADHSVTYNGKKYTNDGKGNYSNDEVGALAFKNRKGKDKPVSAMSNTEAAFYDSKRKSFSNIRSEKKSNQEKKVSEAKDKIQKSDVNNDELMRTLQSSGTDRNTKQAVAMTLAERGAFKNRDQVDLAKDTMSSNEFAQKKFTDAMHSKGQSHLMYRIDKDENTKEGQEARAMMAGDLAKKKFDVYNLQDSAYEEAAVHEVAAKHSGDHVYGQRIADVAKSADAEEKVQKGLTAAKNKSLSSGGTLLNADGNIDKFAKALANTGKPLEAFIDKLGNLDVGAMDAFHGQADRGYIDNLDHKEVGGNQELNKSLRNHISMDAVGSAKRGGKANQVVDTILKSMDEEETLVSQLVARNKNNALKGVVEKSTKTARGKDWGKDEEEVGKRVSSIIDPQTGKPYQF
jgi:hypothetical protein